MSNSISPDILVVEDEADLSDFMKIVLEDEGYQVAIAEHGLEALKTIEECGKQPRLIVLDVKMPVMNGKEFVAEYRRLYQHTAPIIVITAADDVRQRAEELGGTDWLGKPFDLGKFVDLIKQYIPL
jgi:DNA-binding response OmpR family regulator